LSVNLSTVGQVISASKKRVRSDENHQGAVLRTHVRLSVRRNEFELSKLSLRELLALAKLLGCSSCGSKEAVIVRLLAQRELRLKLARFTDNPEELAISYKRESLRDMCREAGIWRSGNKRALSASLLNWRDRCRARGQAFLAEMRSLAKDRPQQLSFRFQDLS
jgi:hypothetical protein